MAVSKERPPRRKAAPKIFHEVEGIPSEEEGEAPPPENEYELLNEEDDDISEGDKCGGDESGGEDVADDSCESEEECDDKKRRNFKIVPDSIQPPCDSSLFKASGRSYHGKMPMQAAKKAYTKIARSCDNEGDCAFIFSIQETTRGSNRKVFTYSAKREILDPPRKIGKKGADGEEISYLVRYKPIVKAHRVPVEKKESTKKSSKKTSVAEKETQRDEKSDVIPAKPAKVIVKKRVPKRKK